MNTAIFGGWGPEHGRSARGYEGNIPIVLSIRGGLNLAMLNELSKPRLFNGKGWVSWLRVEH